MTHPALVLIGTLLALQPAHGQDPQFGSKYTDGVSFTATDSVRSWSLDITFHDRLTFRAPIFGNEPFEAAVKAPSRTAQGNVLSYHARSNHSEIIVTVQEPEDKSTRTCMVQVEVMPAEGGVKVLHTGTGRFLPPQELHYAWRLTSLNGEAIDPKRFRDAPPGLTFQVPRGTVTGTTGCNALSGDFNAGYRVLRFGRLVRTRNPCPPSADMEDELVRSIGERELRYSVTPSELRLRHADGTELVFRRMR